MDILKTPLMGFLKANHDVYPGKVLELREAISGWLSYIPQTFPHYTRHTIDHSDEIVLQMSKLLFQGNNPAEPVIPISATEAYIAIAAAYLHDAGMVCSDQEKAEILESKAWKGWVTGAGAGAERWAAIQALREGAKPEVEEVRHFLADVQTRFLLAEFIRRTHHRRAANILEQHQAALGRFALDNPALLRAISNVCVAHGLRQHELEDRERYPEECDIGPDRVNVRFIAILLRLGDLLDVRYDRACPLLLNPASPLPSESFAHWSQYRQITHRLTSPERIELTAECETQEEHRVIQDWCQWLVDEVKGARTLMARATRHHMWQLPQAELIGEKSTIRIRPAQTAKYLPLEWRFELDKEVVFNLLIRDVYESKNVFVRELLQNAFDATRCQMYLDMAQDGEPLPEYPNQVNEERRRRYPVRISVIERPVPNELSGQEEARQFVVVEDQGIGMDKEIIQKYFLQVGRSFYVTDEFQRNFRFVPTSRFGVGFLSVFAVSDCVVVESYKLTSRAQDGPIRLTLSGPKNYLLTERGDRRIPGTRIEVALSESLERGELADLVSGWCRRVEFPILVDDLGETTTVTAEQPASLIGEEPDLADPEASFAIRCFPIVAPGITGEIYIFSHAFTKGESWVDWTEARHFYLAQNPRASIPPTPESLTCFHGIRVSNELRNENKSFAIRLDIRKGNHPMTLARGHLEGHEARHWTQNYPPEVAKRFGEILSGHMSATPFAKGAEGWKYKQRLIFDFPLPISFWRTVPETVGTIINRTLTQKSIAEVEEEVSITVAVPVGWSRYDYPSVREKWIVRMLLRLTALEGIVIPAYYLPRLEEVCRAALLRDRYVADVRFISNSVMAFTLRRFSREEPARAMTPSVRSAFPVAHFPEAETIGFGFHSYFADSLIVLNSQNALVQWYLKAQDACQRGLFNLNRDMLRRLERLLGSAISQPYGQSVARLAAYVDAWSTIPDLPPELHPPKAKLEREGFMLHRRKPIKKLPRRRGARWS